jgi:hypothetical protein
MFCAVLWEPIETRELLQHHETGSFGLSTILKVRRAGDLDTRGGQYSTLDLGYMANVA